MEILTREQTPAARFPTASANVTVLCYLSLLLGLQQAPRFSNHASYQLSTDGTVGKGPRQILHCRALLPVCCYVRRLWQGAMAKSSGANAEYQGLHSPIDQITAS